MREVPASHPATRPVGQSLLRLAYAFNSVIAPIHYPCRSIHVSCFNDFSLFQSSSLFTMNAIYTMNAQLLIWNPCVDILIFNWGVIHTQSCYANTVCSNVLNHFWKVDLYDSNLIDYNSNYFYNNKIYLYTLLCTLKPIVC